jgi:hypothetical protein
MRIAVTSIGKRVFYLNFDLIVEFSFDPTEEKGKLHFTYSSTTQENSFDRFIVSEEEKNRILNKLDLL